MEAETGMIWGIPWVLVFVWGLVGFFLLIAIIDYIVTNVIGCRHWGLHKWVFTKQWGGGNLDYYNEYRCARCGKSRLKSTVIAEQMTRKG